LEEREAGLKVRGASIMGYYNTFWEVCGARCEYHIGWIGGGDGREL
jgi:hypothetical protein